MEASFLESTGLSNREAKVYLSCLELGTAKVATISKRVDLPRTTVYGILSKLISIGFVSYVVKSNVKYFEAVEPEKIIGKMGERIYKFKLLIPELNKIKKSVLEKPHIEVYEGKEGIKSIYEDMLKTNKLIYGYGATKILFKFLKFYIPGYIRRRAKAGIRFLIVTEDSKEAREMKLHDKKELRKTAFLDIIKNMTTVNYIYGNKVATMTLAGENPIGIITESEDIAKTQKIIFNALWKIAKK